MYVYVYLINTSHKQGNVKYIYNILLKDGISIGR